MRKKQKNKLRDIGERVMKRKGKRNKENKTK